MIQTIKDLRKAIVDIPEDNIVYIKTIDGNIFDIRCIDDATSAGFWELKLSDTCTAYSKNSDDESKKKMNTLYCANCGSINVVIAKWVNPNSYEIGDCYSSTDDKQCCWCDNCNKHVELMTLSELWEIFSKIPVNYNDEIEKGFLGFDAGTSKFDVWHWFDERCPNNLHDDLMFPKTDIQINWELYRKNLEGGLINERLWELGCNGDYNPHTENIQVIEKELKLIQYGDYDSILKMHNKEYFEEFREA